MGEGMGRHTITLLILLFCQPAISAQITLPRDANGWTIFTPSSESRIVYVASDGNDSTGVVYTQANHPSWSTPFEPGTVNAFATYAAAYANTRDGYPDWILMKRGDAFIDSIGTQVRSGRDSDEPFLIGAYGNSGVSPLFKTGSDAGIRAFNGKSWIAVSGLSFYAHTRDPDSIDYTGTDGSYGFDFENNSGYSSEGVLIEGCKFRFYENNAIGSFTHTTGTLDGATIRRCVITDNYEQGGHTQNLWSYGINNLIVDECVFDHGGWYDDYTGSIGTAHALSHNTYFASVQNVTFKNNIFSRPSSGCNKFTAEYDSSGLKLSNNFYFDCEIVVSLGVNYRDNIQRFYNPIIENNVIQRTGYTSPSGTTAKWGIWASGWAGGTINGNLFIDGEVTGSNSNAIRFYDINNNVSVENNVSIGQIDSKASVWYQTDRGEGTGIVFSGNILEASGNYQNFIYSTDQTLSGFTFVANTWYSSTNTNFVFDGTAYTDAQWLASVEPTATFTQPDHPDRTRNIQTYMTSIGKTNTVDAFITAARNQDRYDWDTDLVAPAVNDWLRAGFGLEEYMAHTTSILPGQNTEITTGTTLITTEQ